MNTQVIIRLLYILMQIGQILPLMEGLPTLGYFVMI